MTSSDPDEGDTANRRERRRRIREWAAYVRTHPDEDWGAQVNELVDAQIRSARHFEDSRPDMEELRESPLFDD